MSNKRDRVKPLFEAIAAGNPNGIRQTGKRLLQEIQQEQAALTKDAKLLKELLARYGGPIDTFGPSERSAKVRETALAMAMKGRTTITAHEVVAYLAEEENIAFDVERPASVVGTILNSMDAFKQIEKGKYRYRNGSETAA